MDALGYEGVSHAYGNRRAVRDFTLSVRAGEVVCLVGPSGCGKTTALRLAAGLERLQKGRVVLAGLEVATPLSSVPPERRSVGLVFQDYALFPHLTARENVAFGLAGIAASERKSRADEAIARVGMSAAADAYPHMLSGGQQQRIALARALAPRPAVMLLDEPFSGLDAQLRQQVRDDTLHVLKSAGTATLLVTHDAEEAMFMGDRIAVMRDGLIAQTGRPEEIYSAPASAFVAGFFGEVNRIPGDVHGGRVATPLGPIPAQGLADGTAALVLVRPEGVVLRLAGAPSDPNLVPFVSATARVLAARMLGRSSLVHLSLEQVGDGAPLHLHSRMPGIVLPPENSVVRLVIDRRQLFVFAAGETM
ncbi:MAG: ABC transporter ATP-binding protein [Alphaproteobacteria bacterium]|nr:ABC transporter ATP-binding protein [Alphaproteobacteria bacterium]